MAKAARMHKHCRVHVTIFFPVQDFVWFILSSEDKRTTKAVEFWFRCMDLDGDGKISMYELEYFYEEQLKRYRRLIIRCGTEF